MGISFANLAVILLIILVIFGAGKLPSVMGDLGRGIRNFRKGLKDENEEESKKIYDVNTDQQQDKHK